MADPASIIAGVDVSQFNAGGLRFPSDVGAMSTGKHYITFFINEQENARIRFSSGAVNPTAAAAVDQNTGNSSAGNMIGISVPRAPTKRLAGSITLYMPNQISVQHKANYGEAEVGLVGAAAMAAFKSYQQGGVALADTIDAIKANASAEIAGAFEGAGVTGAKAIESIMTGKTTNNRTEMKFEGIDRRSFQFTFRLMPRSAEEANSIQQIVTMFRLHSMPEFANEGGGRTLISPSTFDIVYSPGEHLHRISTSVLESIDVRFGGDRPQFFSDNHPVETQLTLQFKELEIITKERINQGY